MTKKYIIFDYDDTLVDTLGSRIPAIIEFCRNVYGVSISAEQIFRTWGVPFDQMMRVLGCSGDIDKNRYVTIAQKYPIRAFPESDNALGCLIRAGHTLGIVTSVTRAVLDNDLVALGWNDERFSARYAQEDTPAHKPDMRVFAPVIESLPTLGMTTQDLLYIGNSLSDSQAAMSAGLTFIGIARSSGQAEAFARAGVPYVADLVEIVRSVCSSGQCPY